MKDLFAIFQQYLFEHLVNQTDIENHKRIHYAIDPFLEDKKDYIVILFNAFNNRTLQPNIENKDTQREITEEKTCTITIQYIGHDAFRKLNDIMDKMRSSNSAHNFLKSQDITLEPINIINVSDLIGDNLIESANLDCKVYYTTLSFDNNVEEDIENIDTEILLN